MYCLYRYLENWEQSEKAWGRRNIENLFFRFHIQDKGPYTADFQ